MAGLVSQLGVRIALRDRGRIGRIRLGVGPVRGSASARGAGDPAQSSARVAVAVAVAVAVDDAQLGAQALQSGVSLDVGGVDQQPSPADQAGVGALAQNAGEQLLEDRGLRKAPTCA